MGGGGVTMRKKCPPRQANVSLEGARQDSGVGTAGAWAFDLVAGLRFFAAWPPPLGPAAAGRFPSPVVGTSSPPDGDEAIGNTARVTLAGMCLPPSH